MSKNFEWSAEEVRQRFGPVLERLYDERRAPPTLSTSKPTDAQLAYEADNVKEALTTVEQEQLARDALVLYEAQYAG